MFGKDKPTLREETSRRYWLRYLQLKKQFETENAIDALSPEEVAAFLIGRKEMYSMSTFRQYKASVLYVLRSQYPDHELAIASLEAESSAGLAKRSTRTSGRKLKYVPDEDWKKLEKTLENRIETGHKNALGLLYFLQATLATGLRPVEWCYSEAGTDAASGREILRVKNAKFSNSRANGEFREMYIDGLQAAETAAVKGAIAFCSAENDEQAERVLKALRNEFDKTRRLAQCKSGITIYSFRHQFLADAKKTFADAVLISALAGHSSTRTAFEHYGKRRYGSGRVKVTPAPESYDAVRKARQEIYKSPALSRNNGTEVHLSSVGFQP